MKKIFSILLISVLSYSASAQLSSGFYANNIVATDQFGTTHSLYDYLNANKTVYVFLTGCCYNGWDYFNTNTLYELYVNHGPTGLQGVSSNSTNDIMVLCIESDPSTNDSNVMGLNGYPNNWLNPTGLSPTPLPICNPSVSEYTPIFINYDGYPEPELYRICPNRTVTELKYWSQHFDTADELYNTSLECSAPATNPVDPAILEYVGPESTCSNAPISVILQNHGTLALNACSFNVTGGNNVINYNWSGNLPSYAIDTVLLGNIDISGDSQIIISITTIDNDVTNNMIEVPISSTISTNIVKVDVLLDEWGGELSWDIKNESGVIVAASNPYTQSDTAGTNIIEIVNLSSNGCYSFSAYDAYGDGLFGSQYSSTGTDGHIKVTSISECGQEYSEVWNYNGSYDFAQVNRFFHVIDSPPSSIGCNDLNACNYNANDVCSNACIYPGCTNALACNFNPSAGCDDGSCHYTNTSCNDNNANTILDVYNSNCNCVGIPYSYGSVASSTNTICPEVSDFNISTNSAPTGITNYSLQWYFKTGNNGAPTGESTSGWNIIPGATSSSLSVDAFTGTRTYACFVTPDASYGIPGNWMSGAKVLTYSSFAAQTIIGNPNVTPFNAYNYIVNPIPGHTYNWSVTNGAIASGQGTNNVSIMWGQNGPYQLTLTESDGTCSGSSYLFAVNNNCSISVSAASASANTFCAGTTLQLQAATSATGITYQWYLNGVVIPNETNQTISVSSGGNYQVSINQSGCTAVSNIVSITELPSAIIPSILVEQANAGCAGGDATLTVSGGNYTNLVWSNGLTANSIIVNTSGDYSITAIDENGCAVTAGPVAVNFSILDPVPVCIVTVDQVTGKNNVVWEPITSDLINSYVILKETNVANEYAQIGTVAYGSNGLFEDVNSTPQVQANRYKLALIDTCGIQSSASSFHKTIHLTTNLGVGNNVNLIWSNYEGFDFGSYSIYRGTSPNTLNLLSTIASNLNSYTDVNPPAGETYYMIEVEGVSCDPQRTLVYSNSNILDTTVGIEDYTSTTISLYPNPANAVIMLQVNNTLIGQEYVVFDAIGKVIYKNKIQSANEIIQLENFNNGNYFVKVNEMVKRFVVQH